MTAPGFSCEDIAHPLQLNLIGGERRPASDGRVLDVLRPSDGLPFAA